MRLENLIGNLRDGVSKGVDYVRPIVYGTALAVGLSACAGGPILKERYTLSTVSKATENASSMNEVYGNIVNNDAPFIAADKSRLVEALGDSRGKTYRNKTEAFNYVSKRQEEIKKRDELVNGGGSLAADAVKLLLIGKILTPKSAGAPVTQKPTIGIGTQGGIGGGLVK